MCVKEKITDTFQKMVEANPDPLLHSTTVTTHVVLTVCLSDARQCGHVLFVMLRWEWWVGVSDAEVRVMSWGLSVCDVEVRVMSWGLWCWGESDELGFVCLWCWGEKSSRGLIVWRSVENCIESLACANHAEIPNPGQWLSIYLSSAVSSDHSARLYHV